MQQRRPRRRRESSRGPKPSPATWAKTTTAAPDATTAKAHPTVGAAVPAEVMWFRGRKATLRDQADAIERNAMRSDQIVARLRLANLDRRIGLLTKLVDRVGR